MNNGKVRTTSPAHTDAGAGVIMVLMGMIVLAMFATVALTYSTRTLKTTRHTQDSIAALAAAQGGADEYIARLNNDDDYWQKMPDCLNPAMRKPLPVNPKYTCTPATAVGWAPLPGAAEAATSRTTSTTPACCTPRPRTS